MPGECVGQDQRPGGAIGQAPFAQAGDHVKVRRRRAQTPHIGQPVQRHHVLRGPAEAGLPGAETFTGEVREAAVAEGSITGLGGAVPLPAGENITGTVDVDLQDGAHRLVHADKRPVQGRGRCQAGNKVGPVQVAPLGKETRVANRNIGGNDHLPRPDRAAPGLDDARCAIADRGHARVLKNVVSAAVHCTGQTLQVFHRVKLRLAVEPDCAPDSEWQRHV